MNWNEISLGEVLTIRHGYAFKSAYFASEGQYVVLTPGNFHEEGGFRDQPGKDRYYIGDIPERFILEKGDLLVVMTEQMQGLLGSPGFVPSGDRYLHNQRLGLVTDLNYKKIDKIFLYHLFNIHEVRHQVSASATGTKVRHTAPERIYRVRVRVPQLAAQRRIGAILSAYDDLIENNLRRITLLEKAARLIYEEWFVRLRFPGYEHTRIIDGIPEGWRTACVSDLGNVVTGKTPSTKYEGNYGGHVPFIKTPDMHASSVVIKTDSYLSEEGAESQAGKYIPPHSVMVACIGNKLGVVALNAYRAQTNQQINSVVPRRRSYTYYSYFVLSDMKSRLEALGGGATMPNVNKSKFERLPSIIPSTGMIEQFHDLVEPMFRQLQILTETNLKLAEARDLLRPRLMSGEIAV